MIHTHSKMFAPILIGIVFSLSGLALFGLLFTTKFQPASAWGISNYAECVKSAGSLVTLTYPPMCMTAEGERFTASADEVGVELINPGLPDPSEDGFNFVSQPVDILSMTKGTFVHSKPLILTGTVLYGDAVNKPYCVEGVYIQDGTGVIMLRGLNAEEFVGQTVDVLGTYEYPSVRCTAETCGCEDYFTATKIEPVK